MHGAHHDDTGGEQAAAAVVVAARVAATATLWTTVRPQTDGSGDMRCDPL